MARYKATTGFSNSRFYVREGDVVEIDDAEAERLERDSPGTFEKVEEAGAGASDDEAVEAGLLGEHGAEIKAELESQIPTIDIDPEDKAREIPGEGNKFTPASGYNPEPGGVRVVERAANDRQHRGAAKRGEDEVVPADLSAQARVTDATPASEVADEKQLAGGVTSHDTDADRKAAEKKAAADKQAAANKGTITAADFKATKKG